MTRRDLFRRVLGALVASRLPFRSSFCFTPRYYSVPVTGAPEYCEEIVLAELNAVTMREILPGVVDDLLKTEPVLAQLRRRG